MARKTFKRGNSKFIKLDHWLHDHPAYRSLSPAAKVVLQAIWRRHNGHNNGELIAPISHLTIACAVSQNTVRRSIDELESTGFLVTMEKGHLGVSGKGRASRYRITFLPTSDGKGPSMDFRKI